MRILCTGIIRSPRNNFFLNEHTSLPETFLKWPKFSDLNLIDGLPSFLKQHLKFVPIIFLGENFIIYEVSMDYLHEYLKKLSSIIIDLIKNESENFHNFEQIKKYEDALLETLICVDNFFSFPSNSSYFDYYFAIFSDELFEILLFTDNWDIIAHLCFLLKIQDENLYNNVFSRMQLKNRKLVIYIQKFFYEYNIYDLNSNSNPLYEPLLYSEEFVQLKQEFEKTQHPISSHTKNRKDSMKLHGTFKQKDIKIKAEYFEIKNLNKIYPSKMPSFIILQKILKEKDHIDLRESDFQNYISLIYSIKYLKMCDQPLFSISYLTSMGALNIIFLNENSTSKTKEFENYLLFLYCPISVVKDVKLLKNFLKSLSFLSLTEPTFIFLKEKEEFQELFCKKLCEVAFEIIKTYPYDYEILYLVFANIIKKCIKWIKNLNNFKLFDYFNPLILDTYFRCIGKNERFIEEPLLALNDDKFISFFNILTLIFQELSQIIQAESDLKIIYKQLITIIKNIIESFLTQKYSDLMSKISNINSLMIFICNFQFIIDDAKCINKEIFNISFQNLLPLIKSSNNKESLVFYNEIISLFIANFQTEEDKNKKQALYYIMEKLYLQENIIPHYECFKIYEKCILHDLMGYLSLDELKKNESDYKNCENYIKIYLKFRVNKKRNEKNYCLNINFLKLYEVLVKNEVIKFYEDIQKNVIIPEINELTQNLEKFIINYGKEKVFKAYLLFFICKYKKIRRGITKVLYSIEKELQIELNDSEFKTIINVVKFVYSHPLLLSFKEKKNTKKAFSHSNLPNIANELFLEILNNFDSFEKSFYNLAETTKKNDVIFLHFFSDGHQFSCYQNSKKLNFEIAEFYMNSLIKINNLNLVEDLKNLSKMKFLLFYINLIKKDSNNANNYLKLAERIENIFFYVFSKFSENYIKSQVADYENFKKKDLWDFTNTYEHLLVPIPPKRNIIYKIISHYFSIIGLLNNHKLIKRVLNFPKKIIKFNNAFKEKETFKKYLKNFEKNLVKQYPTISMNSLNLRVGGEMLISYTLLNFIISYYLSESKSYMLSRKKKLMMKMINFIISLKLFCETYEIDHTVRDNKSLNDDMLFKVTIFRLSRLNFNLLINTTFLESIFGCVTDDFTSKFLLEKIEVRLPFFSSFISNLKEISEIFFLDNFSLNHNIAKTIKSKKFPNNQIGKQQKNNVWKVYSSVAQLVIDNMIKIELSDVLKKLCETQCDDDDEVMIIDRKIICLKISDIIQKIINEFDVLSFNLLEDSSIVKEIHKEINEEKAANNIFEINILKFKNLTLSNKFSIFIDLMRSLEYLSYYQYANYELVDNFFFNSKVLITNFMILSLRLTEKIMSNQPNETRCFFLFSNISDKFLNVLNELLQNEKLLFFEKNIEVIRALFRIYFSKNNVDQNITHIVNLLKMLLEILKCADIQDNSERSNIIYEEVQKIIFNLGYINFDSYSSYAKNTYLYFLLIFEKLLIHFDKSQNFRRINIELKIKEMFYDNNSNEAKKIIKYEFLLENKELSNCFTFNGKLFYEVLQNLCEFSEDKEKITLRSGIGNIKFFLIFFYQFN